MKTCSKCGETKSLNLFSIKTCTKDGYQGHCKSCAASYQIEWHQANKSWRGPQIKKRKERLRNQNRVKLVTYLQYHPCVDCGETDPIVLQFDHIKGDKERNISEMVSAGETWYAIVLEIRKCQVRCANCHLKATAQRGNFYKTRKEFQLPNGATGSAGVSEAQG
jgi:hypothetical protein